MSAGGGAYPIVPPLPEYEKRDSRDTTSGTKGGTTTNVLADVQQQALGEIDKTVEAQKAGTGEVRTQAERIGSIEAQGLSGEQGVAAWKLAQLTGQPALDADQMVARARDNVKAQQARYGAMEPPKLFANATGWQNVKTAAAMALGGISDALRAKASILSGQGMPTFSAVLNIVDKDIERQKAAIDKLKDSVVMARTGLSDAEDARRQLRGDIDLKGMAMLDNVRKLTTARLGAAKMAQPEIDQHQAILALDAKKADYKSEYVKGLTTSIQSGWDKSTKVGVDEVHRVPTPGGGGEGKIPGQTAALARQALAEAERLEGRPTMAPETLNKLQDNTLNAEAADAATEKGAVVGGAIARGGRALDVVPRTRYDGLSEQDRITATGMDAMVTSLQHLMTGAGAPAEEARIKARTYGYAPGDTPAAMTDKLRRAKELAGQYLPKPGAATPAAGAPAAGAAPGTPAPKPVDTKRTALVKNLKANPAWQKTKAAKKAMADYGVTPEELK